MTEARKQHAMERINHFASLKKNWNSYGAEPFQPEVIQAAIEALEWIPDAACTFPCGDGGIQFEWDKAVGEDKKVSFVVEVLPC